MFSVDYRDDLSAISLAHLRAASGWQQQYKLIIQWGKLIAPKPALRIADKLDYCGVLAVEWADRLREIPWPRPVRAAGSSTR